ncbi:hypothetical protein NEOLEDRAFT_1179951, partial [Neolentinus lepideus HHB14362 ss-1]
MAKRKAPPASDKTQKFCYCHKCHGGKSVSQRTWERHKEFRDEADKLNNGQATSSTASSSMYAANTTSRVVAPSVKRQRAKVPPPTTDVYPRTEFPPTASPTGSLELSGPYFSSQDSRCFGNISEAGADGARYSGFADGPAEVSDTAEQDSLVSGSGIPPPADSPHQTSQPSFSPDPDIDNRPQTPVVQSDTPNAAPLQLPADVDEFSEAEEEPEDDDPIYGTLESRSAREYIRLLQRASLDDIHSHM